jgi:hypothetical protein
MLPPFFVYLVVDPAVVGVRVRSPELWPRTPVKSWLSVRRVHVINSTQLEVYCRDLRGSFYPQTAGDDWVCRVERVSSGWRLLRCDPIMIITELDLTNRCSQPLAAVTPMFNFMKQYSVFAMLAAASGGSAPSR